MTRLLGSLTNRLFLASATLAVASILAAVWWMDRSITAQAEREIDRGLAEAGALVDEYRRLSLSQLAQAAELIADLPKFKAAVELNHPPTVAPLAADYRRELNADVFVVTGRDGRVLAREGLREWTAGAPPSPSASDLAGPPRTVRFLPGSDGIVQLVTVPVWIDPAAPDVLGALSVGVALDSRFASQIEQFTDSDIAFAWNGRVKAATIHPAWRSALEQLLAEPGGRRVSLGGDEYAAIVRPLSAAIPTGSSTLVAPSVADPRKGGAVIVLRSRTERLRPLQTLHTALGIIALTAVLAATLSSYLVARTVTRPIRAITAAMRDMAATGDLTRFAVPSPRWGDEDARLLAHTFNTMTAAIERFQREATQRERLSSLGRLSTVIAHEIRNPLMIIKSALRTLRRSPHVDEPVRAAVEDIDGEVGRLDRLVKEVLDFARPIRFDLAPARLSVICENAARAAGAGESGTTYRLLLDPAADAVVTDAERLCEALVNLLTNARESMTSSGPGASHPTSPAPEVEVATRSVDGEKVQITIRDRGPGIDPAALPRIFEPFFTTKTTGTGIGLAITSNIINGLGGSVHARSGKGEGTEMVVELPRAARVGGTRS